MNIETAIHNWELEAAPARVGAPAKSPLLLVGTFLSGSLNQRSVCEDLAARLSASGWPVITTSDKVGRAARLADMVATVWRRRREYAVAQVDVYSGPAFFWAEAVCAALRLAGKPYLLTLHGGNLPAFAERWPHRVRRLLGRAAAVTTPSRYLLDRMAPYAATGLTLLPNPLEIENYPFRLRERLEPRLVWLRAFRNIYHPSLAPQVLAALTADFPAAQLLMVGVDKGDGSRQLTERTAAQLGVAERLTFVGGVPKQDVPQWLNRGDIFLNTTNVDNTPVSVLEAMATGLCVVSTNVGGIPYLLDHEVDSLLVAPGEAGQMAAAVRRLLMEPGLAARLSANARQKAVRSDWTAVLPQWEELLASFAGKGRQQRRARVE